MRSAPDDIQSAFGAILCRRATERPIHPQALGTYHLFEVARPAQNSEIIIDQAIGVSHVSQREAGHGSYPGG